MKSNSDKEVATGLGDPVLLKKIDKLFACGVGEHVNLPQMVVVGDQSSGKSSVLAGLMRLPFPRDSGLCTRFATQIIFRRTTDERVTITVIPDPNASAKHIEDVQSWSFTDLQRLDENVFVDVMKEVCHVLS